MGIEELDRGELRKIFIIPHSHHDFAWVYERDWHVRRYIRLFEEVVEWLDRTPGATWHIDNVIHSLEPFEENSPEYFRRFREYVRQGRIEVTSGGYSLARPSYVGEETFIRNLQAGSEYFLEHLGTLGNDMYSNIDTASGQRQLPQILGLMGFKYYFFYRPLVTLDKKGVPRQFYWQGLDGSKVLTLRDSTTGMYSQNYSLFDYEKEWDKARTEFWNQELSHRRPEGLTFGSVEYLPCGCDDCRPGVNIYDKPVKTPEFIAEWNSREKTELGWGTPSQYFEALDKCGLPVWDGELDESELTYNLPAKGEASMWRQRLELDQLLVRLESLCAIAALAGEPYPEAEIKEIWYGLFEITGHAIDFVMKHDDELLMDRALAAKYKARTLTERYARRLAYRAQYSEGMLHSVANTLPYARTELVRLFVTPYDGLKPFELYDERGNVIPYQVTRINSHFDVPEPMRRYDYTAAEVVAKLTLPPFGAGGVYMRPSGESEIPTPQKSAAVESAVISNGVLTLTFEGCNLTSVEKEGKKITAPEGGSLIKLVCRNHPQYKMWMYLHEVTSEDLFVGEKFTLVESGPLRSRVKLEGKFNDRQSAEVELTLEDGEPAAKVCVTLNCEPDNCTFSFGFACGESPVYSDFYFGANRRETTPFYNSIGDAYIDGQIYGRNWVSFESGGVPAAIISGDCSVYYVHDIPAGFMELFLVRNCTYDSDGEHWTTNLPATFGLCGKTDYNFMLAFPELADAFVQLRTLTDRFHYAPVAASKQNKFGSAPLPASFMENASPLVMTAAYMEGGNLILRLYEAEGRETPASLTFGFDVASCEAVDLLGQPLGLPVTVSGRKISFTAAPYKIITLRVTL